MRWILRWLLYEKAFSHWLYWYKFSKQYFHLDIFKWIITGKSIKFTALVFHYPVFILWYWWNQYYHRLILRFINIFICLFIKLHYFYCTRGFSFHLQTKNLCHIFKFTGCSSIFTSKNSIFPGIFQNNYKEFRLFVV